MSPLARNVTFKKFNGDICTPNGDISTVSKIRIQETFCLSKTLIVTVL